MIARIALVVLALAGIVCAPAIGQVIVRINLAAPLFMWFADDGNNNNDGLTTTTPVKDVQVLVDRLADNYDLRGFKAKLGAVHPSSYFNKGVLTSKCFTGQGDADGTFTSRSAQVEIDGAGSGFVFNDPALAGTDRSYIFSIGSNATGERAPCTAMTLSNVVMSSNVPLGGGHVYANGGVWRIGAGVVFGSASGAHMLTDNAGGQILVMPNLPNPPFNRPNTVRVVGSAGTFCGARALASCTIQSINLDCGGLPLSFNNGFVNVSDAALAYPAFSTWTNCASVTGFKFVATGMSQVITATGNLNFLPGTLNSYYLEQASALSPGSRYN